MSIDISTHQLAEITATAMGGGAKIDEVLTVWHGIGKTTTSCIMFLKRLNFI
jgi:hypothetical protein